MVEIITDYGFCFGVENAIEKIIALKNSGKKIYLTHPLLHNIPENTRIMEEVHAQIYKDDIPLEKEDVIVLSAHGHAIEEERHFSSICHILDCTCPLIQSRYKIIKQFKEDVSYLYLGKKNHQETIGFLSHFPYFQFLDSGKDVESQISSLVLKDKVCFVPQTTVSQSSWSKVRGLLQDHEIIQILPICPLYQKRSNQAIERLSSVDSNKSVYLVCGDKSSSNAKEIHASIHEARKDIPGFIVLSKEDFPYENFIGYDFYIASATSVSRKTVENLKNQLELL
jgi:small subunit ribosomal protein S1